MQVVGVMMMNHEMMMVLEVAEEAEALYSSILQDLLIFQVQLMPEVETAEMMLQVPTMLERVEVVLVAELYFKV